MSLSSLKVGDTSEYRVADEIDSWYFCSWLATLSLSSIPPTLEKSGTELRLNSADGLLNAAFWVSKYAR